MDKRQWHVLMLRNKCIGFCVVIVSFLPGSSIDDLDQPASVHNWTLGFLVWGVNEVVAEYTSSLPFSHTVGC